MNAVRLGIQTVFNTTNDFNTDVSGRLFFGAAPDETNLQEGPYAIYFIVSDTDQDNFSDNMRELYLQFSLFSGASSPATILAMDTHLTTLFKDTVFTVTGWTVVIMKRVQGNGPYWTPAETETGTPGYWQTDIDFTILISKA